MLSRCGVKAVLLGGFCVAVQYLEGSTGAAKVLLDLLYGEQLPQPLVCLLPERLCLKTD